MKNIQKHVLWILEKVLHQGQNLTEQLNEVWASHPNLSSSERGAIQDISYGVLRYLGELQAELAQYVPKALPQRELTYLLLMALYQLHYTKAAQYAVVNCAVQYAVRIAKGRYKALVNAVLRRALRAKDLNEPKIANMGLEARYNHPIWWIKKLKKAYPEQWESILLASNQKPPMTLRVNPRQQTVEAYLAKLAAVGIVAQHLGAMAVKLEQPVSVSQLPDFETGGVSVQDWGAQQAALLMQAQDDQYVLDACAAPGGKTGHLLELAALKMTALDIDKSRLQRVADNLTRLGLDKGVILQQADASQLTMTESNIQFDLILADVPCSATGVVKRHPDIKWLRRESDFAELARQQAAVASALWSRLKVGGKMLYATCSIMPEENTQQVQQFLKAHSDAALLWEKQLLPTDDQDGFYYAYLAKN